MSPIECPKSFIFIPVYIQENIVEFSGGIGGGKEGGRGHSDHIHLPGEWGGAYGGKSIRLDESLPNHYGLRNRVG